ncbi:MAG TPA: metalloregulator ArsR/SmtB family transcription factor [Opitutaceae bacterium]|nr:metalloregulator ArsR/SmtB family transcription factor [Opitutaceae bacterium]
MTAPNPRLDRTFSALAHPTRRAILQRLSEGDARVTDLAEPFAASLNAISKHILALERANLVIRRKEGREHMLRLNPEPFDGALDWMVSRAELWKRRLKLLDVLLQSDHRNS